ncbi:uncharacterized protein ACO6RY_07104 [Pungitius sinensis]
MHVRASVKV